MGKQMPVAVCSPISQRKLSRARLHGRLPAALCPLRARELRGRGLRRGGCAHGRGFQGEPLRPRKPDARVYCGAGGGLRGVAGILRGLLRRADHQVRAQARGDKGSRGDPAAHGVLRLDGVVGCGLEARPRLHLHQQLAAGAACGERADGRGGGVERSVAGRPARRHRLALRRVRAVEFPGLAGTRPAEALVPGARRRCPDAGAAGVRVVFLVMAALFLIQTLVGAASEHYRADLTGFFGIDLAQVLPYNLMRTWHMQLAIFWVATSFLAAGIFLAPMISGREPRSQHVLAFALLGALAVVVFGSMIGEWLGIFGFAGEWWAWFG